MAHTRYQRIAFAAAERYHNRREPPTYRVLDDCGYKYRIVARTDEEAYIRIYQTILANYRAVIDGTLYESVVVTHANGFEMRFNMRISDKLTPEAHWVANWHRRPLRNRIHVHARRAA